MCVGLVTLQAEVWGPISVWLGPVSSSAVQAQLSPRGAAVRAEEMSQGPGWLGLGVDRVSITGFQGSAAAMSRQQKTPGSGMGAGRCPSSEGLGGVEAQQVVLVRGSAFPDNLVEAKVLQVVGGLVR